MSYYVKITQENEETINLIETQVLERTSGINVAYHAELSPPLNSNPASRLVDGNLTTIARSENPTAIIGGENTFRKVRLIRKEEFNQNLHINEMQIWINGVNVARDNAIPDSFPGHVYSEDAHINNILNRDNLRGQTKWNNSGSISTYPNYLSVTLKQDYKLNDLNTVVIYNRIHYKWRLQGCAVEFLTSDDKVLYSEKINVHPQRGDQYNYYSFNGPNTGYETEAPPSTNKPVRSQDGKHYTLDFSEVRSPDPTNFAKVYFSTLEHYINFRIY